MPRSMTNNRRKKYFREEGEEPEKAPDAVKVEGRQVGSLSKLAGCLTPNSEMVSRRESQDASAQAAAHRHQRIAAQS